MIVQICYYENDKQIPEYFGNENRKTDVFHRKECAL